VPLVPVLGNCDHREAARCKQLLEVRRLRRSVERGPQARAAGTTAIMEMSRLDLVRELEELIIALDRRVARVEQAGEAAIARDAAALRAKAVARLHQLNAVRLGDK
jgi:hypothetical protein